MTTHHTVNSMTGLGCVGKKKNGDREENKEIKDIPSRRRKPVGVMSKD